VITACGPACGWCGRCGSEDERESVLTCDECGSDAVELGGDNDARLCADCIEERDEAEANAAQFFDRR
jgi:hypothetical protein